MIPLAQILEIAKCFRDRTKGIFYEKNMHQMRKSLKKT